MLSSRRSIHSWTAMGASLLITFLLIHGGILRGPLLYLSYYFKLHRRGVLRQAHGCPPQRRPGRMAKFSLRGVAATADEATKTAERIFELRERHRSLVLEENLSPNGLTCCPCSIAVASSTWTRCRRARDPFPTANRLVARFAEAGLLSEVTGQRRSRVFRYDPYLALFDDPVASVDDDVPVEATEG